VTVIVVTDRYDRDVRENRGEMLNIPIGSQSEHACEWGARVKEIQSTVMPRDEDRRTEGVSVRRHDLIAPHHSVADTIGVAHPRQIYDWSQRCLAEFPGVQFDLHLHDTYGRGLANILAALEAGVTAFDTAIGGLGGCPFAPGATGNVPTEDVVALLESMGIQTGVDLDGMIDLSIRTLAQLAQPRRSHLSSARVQSHVADGSGRSSAAASCNAGVEI
jgi:HMGL-like